MAIPLSEKLRPTKFSQIFGQEKLVHFVHQIVQNGKPLSLLLFGPPGCGKTTIARLYAKSFSLPFVNLSAVFNSSAELKKILKEGRDSPLFQPQTILFIDEIHRFNKAQQDIFLPFLEDGSIILIGATTENPSFVLNNALLSRMRVFKLESLSNEALENILSQYEKTSGSLQLSPDQRKELIDCSQGDARHLLNLVENLGQGLPIQQKPPLYDRHEEYHHNLISALHKSIRGSDPDAALYWLSRMLVAGEEPLYLARRLIRVATEDVGLADPQALTQALNAWNTYNMLGSPEGELALAQTVIYLALAPKSTAVYNAYGKARAKAEETSHFPPPNHILNAPTKLMKDLGYGKKYIYDPDTPDSFSGQEYFPDQMQHTYFYKPVERGFEREMQKRLKYFSKLKSSLSNFSDD
jgi:putative ATPase